MMMSDELLRRLGQVERESRPAEEWDEVLEGRMTAAEAVRRGRERDDDADELEALARASAPLDDAERQQWARRARAATALAAEDEPDDQLGGELDDQLDDQPDDGAPANATSDDGATSEPDAPIDLAKERERRRGWLGGLTTLVAVAAALVLWLRAQPGPHGIDEVTGEPLPSFAMIVRNDIPREIRSADDGPTEGPPRYRTNSTVRWTFQPEAPIEGGVELAAIVRGDDGLECLARPTVTRASTEGVLEVRGTVSEALGLGAGHWTLELLVARAGALPADEAGAQCTSPRALPCPCPKPLRRGASIEPAALEPAEGPAAWRTAGSYEMVVEDP